MTDRTYLCIDLKSFYASVECIERGLDPMDTNLVVADPSRTAKTICLAVSPALKSFGVPGRPRLFEVIKKVSDINGMRLKKSHGRKSGKKSYFLSELKAHPEYELDYIVARPRMAHYIHHSAKIYSIYLNYIAPEDIHVYSIDEVFIDLTDYLPAAKKTAYEFARDMILDVYRQTGITAAAGIGTNMYLAKVAMDIEAKKIPADEYGVRIAQLDEMSYREKLWPHRPITDFWRVGRGYEKKLREHGMYTMGDVALCSVGGKNEFHNEELLYRLFGVNAELLIDHAWGWENCRISDIKSYKPENNSVGSGQVLHCAYESDKAKLVTREMADLLSLDLVAKGLATDQIVLTIGYDIENLADPERRKNYSGPVKTDHYGRKVPRHAHGTQNLKFHTSSSKIITNAAMELYDKIIDSSLLVRRINIVANHVIREEDVNNSDEGFEQMDFFTDYEELERKRQEEKESLKKEKDIQRAVIDLKSKFGKNAVLKGMNLKEGATAKDRNSQIGGHKA